MNASTRTRTDVKKAWRRPKRRASSRSSCPRYTTRTRNASSGSVQSLQMMDSPELQEAAASQTGARSFSIPGIRGRGVPQARRRRLGVHRHTAGRAQEIQSSCSLLLQAAKALATSRRHPRRGCSRRGHHRGSAGGHSGPTRWRGGTRGPRPARLSYEAAEFDGQSLHRSPLRGVSTRRREPSIHTTHSSVSFACSTSRNGTKRTTTISPDSDGDHHRYTAYRRLLRSMMIRSPRYARSISEGPPLVHVSRSRRSEIVTFGRQQGAPAADRAGHRPNPAQRG